MAGVWQGSIIYRLPSPYNEAEMQKRVAARFRATALFSLLFHIFTVGPSINAVVGGPDPVSGGDGRVDGACFAFRDASDRILGTGCAVNHEASVSTCDSPGGGIGLCGGDIGDVGVAGFAAIRNPYPVAASLIGVDGAGGTFRNAADGVLGGRCAVNSQASVGSFDVSGIGLLLDSNHTACLIDSGSIGHLRGDICAACFISGDPSVAYRGYSSIACAPGDCLTTGSGNCSQGGRAAWGHGKGTLGKLQGTLDGRRRCKCRSCWCIWCFYCDGTYFLVNLAAVGHSCGDIGCAGFLSLELTVGYGNNGGIACVPGDRSSVGNGGGCQCSLGLGGHKQAGFGKSDGGSYRVYVLCAGGVGVDRGHGLVVFSADFYGFAHFKV